VSFVVHGSPSSQDAPSGLGGFEQIPVPGSHVPASWHWSLAMQTTGLPPTQVPFWQVSVCVHALLSSQGAPFALAGCVQVPP
jgi:hypothetical protein